MEVCPMRDTPETIKLSELRPAEKNIAYVSSDDYAVYDAVLDRFFSTQTFVIGELVFDADWENSQQYVRSEYFNLSDDARKNYRSNNREVRKLRYEFALPFKTVLLISREQEELLFPKGEGGWDRFYRTFPKARGIIYFSSVGFKKYNKNEAIVRVKYQSGDHSERRDFYVLKKIEGKWLVEEVSRDKF